MEGALGGKQQAPRLVAMSFHIEPMPDGRSVRVNSAIDDGNGETTKVTSAELSAIIVSLVQLYGHCAGISYYQAAFEVVGSGDPRGCVGFASAPD